MVETSASFYYVDPGRNRQGPYSEADIVRLIGNGTIGQETLVWSAELTDWRAAGQVEKFAALFVGQQPPPIPSATLSVAPAAIATMPAGNLSADFPVWGLFWRSLLLCLGGLVIVPTPWTNTVFYRFIGTHTILPDGRRLTFAGQPADIWLVFIAIAILTLAEQFSPYIMIIAVPLTAALTVQVIRWFCTKLGTDDGLVKLTFTGGTWTYIGLMVLLYVSFITIIGWAWVVKAMMRWMCQHVEGTLAFDFAGTGLSILWRALAFGLGSVLVIPIPWLLRWYMAWFVSQIQVAQTGA